MQCPKGHDSNDRAMQERTTDWEFRKNQTVRGHSPDVLDMPRLVGRPRLVNVHVFTAWVGVTRPTAAGREWKLTKADLMGCVS